MMVRKRCPHCKGRLDVDPEWKHVKCKPCKIIWDIVPAKNDIGGIVLKHVPEKKKCTICKKTLPITLFRRSISSSDYHTSWCYQCISEKNKQYYNNRVNEYKQSDKIPYVEARQPLSSILNHLIRVSKTGYHANEILKDNIEKIKETIIEGTEAGN